jgi:hypothetical protein
MLSDVKLAGAPRETCLQDVIAQFRAKVKLAFRMSLLSFGVPCTTYLQDVIAQFWHAM